MASAQARLDAVLPSHGHDEVDEGTSELLQDKSSVNTSTMASPVAGTLPFVAFSAISGLLFGYDMCIIGGASAHAVLS